MSQNPKSYQPHPGGEPENDAGLATTFSATQTAAGNSTTYLPQPVTTPGSKDPSLSVAGGSDLGAPKMQVQPWSSAATLKEYLMTDVDPKQATTPLSAFCFMTGFIDAVSFSAIFVWCGFQTGNTVQLALALARLFAPSTTDFSFRLADRQALVSVLTFLGGAFLGRIGDRMGNNTRAWLILGTFIQALFTAAAAIAHSQSNQASVASDREVPAWNNTLTFVALGFMSASIGLQGIMGKRVNSQFATTVVLTTVWCELMSDPKLFVVNRRVITRDHKVIAVFALFLGGFVGRALIDQIGSAGTLGVGAGIKVLISLSWMWIPGKA